MEGDKVLTHNRNYVEKVKSISEWKVSEKEKSKVKEFIERYSSGRITGRIGTNAEGTSDRLLDYLKFGLIHINKDSPTEKDLENFVDKVIKDKLRAWNKKSKQYNGKPYSLASKKATFVILEKYYAWKDPNIKTNSLKITIKEKKHDVNSMSLQEIDLLHNDCKDNQERFFISVLFSSGARSEEFYNLRFSDFTLPNKEESFVKLRLRQQYSKTEGRTISLYYSHALEDVRAFLKDRKSEGCKPEEPVFLKSYMSQKLWLYRLGKRVLKRNVHHHLFRHSCATWLASRLNRQQMCIFFGWKFSSCMPDVYIKREGVDMKEADKTFENTELEDLKVKIDKKDYEDKLKNEQMEELNKKIQLLTTQMNDIHDYTSRIKKKLVSPKNL